MHLAWNEADEQFRAELRKFIAEHAPPDAFHGYDFQDDVATGPDRIPQWLRDWQAKLFDHGWMIPGYPPELGGRNATPVQTLIYLEELALQRIHARRISPATRSSRRACSSSATTSRNSSCPRPSVATPSGASA